MIPYKLANVDTLVYSMTRSSEQVIVGVRDGRCFAQNDRLDNPKYKEFPITEDIRHVVCNMLSRDNQIIVLDDPDGVQEPLF